MCLWLWYFLLNFGKLDVVISLCSRWSHVTCLQCVSHIQTAQVCHQGMLLICKVLVKTNQMCLKSIVCCPVQKRTHCLMDLICKGNIFLCNFTCFEPPVFNFMLLRSSICSAQINSRQSIWEMLIHSFCENQVNSIPLPL